MLVHIYVRHSRTCEHRSDAQYKRCRCTRWVTYTVEGKQRRESTRAHSHEAAVLFARAVEKRYERVLLGEKPKSERTTIEKAVAEYLNDKQAQQLQESTLRKRRQWFEKDLLGWCRTNGVLYLIELDLSHLRQWRSSWELGALAASKKQDITKQFFTFCVASGWLKENPAKGLSRIKVEHKPTDYFTPEEMQKILKAAEPSEEECRRNPYLAPRLHALVQLMRWSGLAIRDAVTLERERLDAEDRLFIYRAKTGTPVNVLLPPAVAQELRDLSLFPNPRYFFWNGTDTHEVVTKHWQHKLKKLFDRVKLRNLDTSLKKVHPHMFRHTFAVQLLLSGLSLHDVAILLGHSTVKTTEKHYAPFVRARQEQLQRLVQASWQT